MQTEPPFCELDHVSEKAVAANRRPLLFTLSAATLIAVCCGIVRSTAFAREPQILGWALTFDLAITIPIIYYWTNVRSGRRPPAALLPIFIISVSIASLVVPRLAAGHFQEQLHLLAVPAEIASIAMVVRRLRAPRTGGTRDARIEEATVAVLGRGPVATAVAGEIKVCAHALFGSSERTGDPRMKISGVDDWPTIAACILMLLAFEAIGMHLLVQLWSVKAAWVLTALDVYSALWIIGDARALRSLQPEIRDGVLDVRFGLRWSVEVPLALIDEVRPVRSEGDWKNRHTLKLALLDEPTILVLLSRPVTATGFVGITRRVTALAVLPVDAAAFEEAISGERRAFADSTMPTGS